MAAIRGAQARPVRLLAAGGTISMQGEHAVPALDAAQLVAAIPALRAYPGLVAENVLSLPSSQLSPAQALSLAQDAAASARAGAGTVITTGTDTLEELAMLCSLIHGGEAPIVITGANRPASAPGADGTANLLDAVAVAAGEAAAGLGVIVVFGGEIHAGTSARKIDSTGPAAFGSPIAGPIGRVVEGRVWLHARPLRPATVSPRALTHRVGIVTAALGDDGDILRAVAAASDGLVVEGFGAGHLTPGMLAALRDASPAVPIVVTCRPERGSMLHFTYGFEGSERDVRASGAICAPFLSPVAARIALMCCLGAELDGDGIASVLAAWDA
jgi:L-asparaginase